MNNNTIERIELTMFSLHPEVKPLYTALKQLCHPESQVVSSVMPITTKTYKKRNESKVKLLEIISEVGRFIKMKWVEDKLLLLGDDVKVSSLLNQMKKEGTLVTYTPTGSRKNYYWGLPEWLDEQGSPKKEHHYSHLNWIYE